MTYKEYISGHLSKFGLTDKEIEFLLSEADLNPDETVSSAEDKVKLKRAIYGQVPLMIAGLSDVSEGGYSVRWNIEGIKAWYSLLAAELGLSDNLNQKAVVRDKSNRW